jgi:hypothetical protein
VNILGIKTTVKVMVLAKHAANQSSAANQNVHLKLPLLAPAVGSILRCIDSSRGMRSAAQEAARCQWEPCRELHNLGNPDNALPENQEYAASKCILVFLAEY